ncbi:MAG: PEP-CTERM sorting domain-containing protein [Verrucomicrobiota bacterium]
MSAALFAHSVAHAQYASSLVNYVQGTGASAGYDNPTSALGEPSRVTSGPFGGPVDPFAPAYQKNQLVSVGSGGSLTVGFAAPIRNDPSNPFGIDFLVFANSGFAVTNAYDEDFNPIGTPATDGSLFGSGATTRVSVSTDGLTFFTLSPGLSPAVDALFPTDGSGDFSKPVNPGLKASDFSGLTLEGIRALYAGSGGGAGFDLSWARDSSGAPIPVDNIRFIRVEVTGGKADIDGFSVVHSVPEPATWAMLALGLGATACSIRASRNRNLHFRRP